MNVFMWLILVVMVCVFLAWRYCQARQACLPSDSTAGPTILIVEKPEGEPVALSAAVRTAGFVNPVVCLPDNQSVRPYLQGVGIYSNRRKFPFPALVLQDVPPLMVCGMVPNAWLEKGRQCRYVSVMLMSGLIEPRHFKDAVAFGTNTCLCKLDCADAMQEMFRVLRRACIEE